MTTDQAATVIENLPFLDLSHMTPENLARIEEIRNIGAVLIPADHGDVIARVRMVHIASVIPVPAGAHVRAHTGSMMMGGEALAEPGGDSEVLVVTGSLIITSPVERVGYREIVVTGSVLAPHGSEAALGVGLTRLIGGVNYYEYQEGQRFQHLAGDVRVGGDTLANAGGSSADVLILAGEVIITSPIDTVGFQRVIYGGQIIAPRESETVLTQKLVGGGDLVWYAGRPRFFKGDETFGRAFFEALEAPTALALVGNVRIDDDVATDLLRQKISEITLVGTMSARKELISVLQVLTTEKYGELVVANGDVA